jgi:hypothetical protein
MQTNESEMQYSAAAARVGMEKTERINVDAKNAEKNDVNDLNAVSKHTNQL